MRKFITIIFLLIYSTLYGQDKIYLEVDKKAEYKGIEGSYVVFVSKNFKYPDGLRRMNASCGVVHLTLLIEKDGTAKYYDCRCGCGSPMCEESKRIVEKMPKWKPAIHKGKKVRSLIYTPFTIDLE